MNFFRLTWKNLRGHRLRSLAILLSTAGLTCFLLAITITMNGARAGTNLGVERMGASIMVVAEGGEYEIVTTSPSGCGGPQVLMPMGSSALLMGPPSSIFMTEDTLAEVAAVPGVTAVSPQTYLGTVAASGDQTSNLYLVAFDPDSDFTLQPWLNTGLKQGLKTGEVIGGSDITADAAHHIELYGYQVTLAGNLQPTGTSVDQSLFMTYSTAQAIAGSSLSTAKDPLNFSAGEISTIMVKTSPGTDSDIVSQDIAAIVNGVVPVESPSLFDAFRRQVAGLLWGTTGIMCIFWGVAAYLIGLIFSASTEERRREIVVLRALGATRLYVFGTIFAEAAALAFAGAVLGIFLSALVLYPSQSYITSFLGMPFLFPGWASLLVLVGIGMVSVFATVSLAVLLPAIRISRMEPAIAARE